MKRTLLILSLITLSATITKAQYNKTRIFVYGEGGLNLATFYQSAGDNTVLDFGNVFGGQLGVYVKGKYPTLVGFDAGVSFSQQGSKFSDSTAARRVFNDSLVSKALLNYAYAYSDALYYFELQGENSVHAGVGLYAGYALSGKRSVGSEKTDIDFGDKWKRLDFGLQLKTGLNIHDLVTVGAMYRVAFLPTLKTTDLNYNNNNGRNSVLTLSVAIRLAELTK